MYLLEILKENQEFLKVAAIEKAMELPVTTLTRAMARGELPEKYKSQIENWWRGFAEMFASNITSTDQISEYAKKIADLEGKLAKANSDLQESLHKKSITLAEFLDKSKEKTKENDQRSVYQKELARKKGVL